MAADRTREIEARVNAATPGPWEADCIDLSKLEPDLEDVRPEVLIWGKLGDDAYAEYADDPRRAIALELISAPVCGLDPQNYRALGNAAFIAHAREDVPWLLARVRELEAERDGLRDWKQAVIEHGLCMHNVSINERCAECDADFERDYPAALSGGSPANEEGET